MSQSLSLALKLKLKQLSKELQFRSPWRRFFFPRWHYMFSPPQLSFLGRCLEDTKALSGCVVEIGCAVGNTTVFLNRYLDALGVERPYYAIDTFSGFVGADLEYEVRNRGKAAQPGMHGFEVNDQRWFDRTMTENGIRRVTSIAADIASVDLETLGPISVVLLDVDLYRPTQNTLPRLYELLEPGGVIVVDDCDASHKRWDGAYQAYGEFVSSIGHEQMIEFHKLGVIRKPAV